MATDCRDQFTFWKVGQQEVHGDFSGGRIVSDAGLLSIRDFDKKLGIVAGLGGRFPGPRALGVVTPTPRGLLTPGGFQILARLSHGNDADKPLGGSPFKTPAR